MADRAIIVVRSPLDCIASLFNMIGTLSHSESLSDAVLERAKETKLWQEFVEGEIKIWNDYHTYWLQRATTLPTHFISYEQLLLDPQTALTQLFQFLLVSPTLENLPIANLIAQSTPKQLYKPRKGTINSNSTHYTQEMRESLI